MAKKIKYSEPTGYFSSGMKKAYNSAVKSSKNAGSAKKSGKKK